MRRGRAVIRGLARFAKPKENLQEYVYLLKAENLNLYKVGTTRNPVMRIKALGAAGPHKLKAIRCIVVDDGLGWERRIHKALKEYRRTGEWFELPEFRAKKLIRGMDMLRHKMREKCRRLAGIGDEAPNGPK